MSAMPNQAYMQYMGGNRLMHPQPPMGMPRYGQPMPRQPFPMQTRGAVPMQRGVNTMGPRGLGMPQQYLQMNGIVPQPRMMIPGAPNPAAVRPSQPGGPYSQGMPGVQPGQPGFKYNTQVRNAPDQFGDQISQQVPMPQQPQQQVVPQQQQAQQPQQQAEPAQVELTAEALASAQPSEQKQMLGERIYPLVQEQIGGDQAGKVTGMLLEIENNELLMMIENKDMLKERIKEACDVLASHTDPVAQKEATLAAE